VEVFIHLIFFLMSLLWFLIIGALAGWIAGELTKGHGFGLVWNIIIGVIGAVIGGFVFGLLGISAYGLLGNLVMSVVGAIILLLLASLVKRT
jgi:uncharacterized membrane protein YeaQ/YmgE (transglycosylase-associated protein family)